MQISHWSVTPDPLLVFSLQRPGRTDQLPTMTVLIEKRRANWTTVYSDYNRLDWIEEKDGLGWDCKL